MKVPSELIADSGFKTHVRDAIRPHLDFIIASKTAGASEAAIHRHLLKQGHKVGSRSGFGAALKFILKEEQSAGAVSGLLGRSSNTAVPVPPHSAKPASSAGADSAEARVPSGRPSMTTAFADHRFQPTFGGH